jgi:hypothetical protein
MLTELSGGRAIGAHEDSPVGRVSRRQEGVGSLRPEPSAHVALGFSEGIDHVLLGLGGVGHAENPADLGPRGTPDDRVVDRPLQPALCRVPLMLGSTRAAPSTGPSASDHAGGNFSRARGIETYKSLLREDGT